ncbi:MAG: FAD-binding oxidoreductase [Candidatus Bathyarchaeia archaeon]
MNTNIKEELRKIVGAENVLSDPETLEQYSKDQSFARPCRPEYVVYVKNVEEVRKVIKLANERKIPVIPMSSGMNLRGATIPNHGGIILNLSKMNKILEVNDKEGWVLIEPGVTYSQLQDEIERRGLRVMIPFGIPPSRSVISSIIEGDPSIAAASFEYGNALYMDLEIVLPTGDIYRLGKWKVCTRGEWGIPGGGGIMGEKGAEEWLWEGAQGTLGIISKMVVKVEHLSDVRKVYFIPFDSLGKILEPLRRIQRKEIGLDCFILNNFNLAAIINEEWTLPEHFPCEQISSSKFDTLRRDLPKWVLIIHLSGLPYFPEEKIRYEETALKKTCEEYNVIPSLTVAGIEGLQDIFLKEILRPWSVLKKARFKGAFHDVAFYTNLSKVTELWDVVTDVAKQYSYDVNNIGAFILPIERGRSCYCEFDFHRNPKDPEDSNKIRRLWLKANEAVMERGALLAKCYGPLNEIFWKKVDPIYVEKLRALKYELDPNNIMNPGKLCF